jgi:hypothetical protein
METLYLILVIETTSGLTSLLSACLGKVRSALRLSNMALMKETRKKVKQNQIRRQRYKYDFILPVKTQ